MKRYLLLVCLLVTFACKKEPPPEVKIKQGLDTLFMVIPEERDLFTKIPVPIELVYSSLPGESLATTTVYQNKAIIKVDLFKIQRKREFVEAVLAHELAHLEDAYLLLGVDTFTAIVERDKTLDWKYRELEKSAVAHENRIRFTLKQRSPITYYRLAETRQI